jgi:hypothetical protein
MCVRVFVCVGVCVCVWVRVRREGGAASFSFVPSPSSHQTPPTQHKRPRRRRQWRRYQTVHGVQATGADAEAAEGSVIISRSHTGKGADVVSEMLPGKKPVFAGGSGYKALRVLKVREGGWMMG